jgi:hypothetical protein
VLFRFRIGFFEKGDHAAVVLEGDTVGAGEEGEVGEVGGGGVEGAEDVFRERNGV